MNVTQNGKKSPTKLCYELDYNQFHQIPGKNDTVDVIKGFETGKITFFS